MEFMEVADPGCVDEGNEDIKFETYEFDAVVDEKEEPLSNNNNNGEIEPDTVGAAIVTIKGPGSVGQGCGNNNMRPSCGTLDRASVSSCSSCSRKSKLRLCLEMNIQQKAPVEREGSESDDVDSKLLSKDQAESTPITVTVDYPEDLVVSVNARVRRVGKELTVTEVDQVFEDKPDGKSEERESSQEEVLNSTFVKAPYTSTMIYPILEESEGSGNMGDGDVDKGKDSSWHKKKITKSGPSGDSSDYQTVPGGSDTLFGNISAIEKSNADRGEQAATSSSRNTAPDEFKKQLSISINSRSRLFSSEKLTPAEKLERALHVLARYRGAWGIFEDDVLIVKHLVSLNSLLTITDRAVIQSTCIEEDYRELNGLISYFILEKRFVIRSELLRTFSILSRTSQAIAAVILASDVPIVLASEIVNGDLDSRQTYEYAVCFLKTIMIGQLSNNQCETIGAEFYSRLVEMIYYAEKAHLEPTAEILLQILLHYHGQLRDDTNLKWKCLDMSSEIDNHRILKKVKQKLTSMVVNNACTGTQSSTEVNQSSANLNDEKLMGIIQMLRDMMVANKTTRALFRDTELDILLVTITHSLENYHEPAFQHEALHTIYRILKIIKTQPSGIDRLQRLILRMLMNVEDESSDIYKCNQRVLKKINRVLANC